MSQSTEGNERRVQIGFAVLPVVALGVSVVAIVLACSRTLVSGMAPVPRATTLPSASDAAVREALREFVGQEVERNTGRSLRGFDTFASVVIAAVSLLILAALALFGLTWWRQTREHDRLMGEIRRCHVDVTSAALNVAALAKEAGEHLGSVRKCVEQAQKAVEEITGLLEQTRKSASGAEADRHFTQALTYQNQGDWDRAIAEYTEAIKARPFALAYNNRGGAWAEKGEHDKAIADYNRAIELDPKGPAFYSNRGVARGRKGEYDKAIDDFNRAIELYPKGAAFYNNRGVAWGRKGQHDKAIEDYRQAIELGGGARPFEHLGEVLISCGDYQGALRTLDEGGRRGLLGEDPNGMITAYLKGVALALAGKPTTEEGSLLDGYISRGVKARGWDLAILDGYLVALRSEDFPAGALETARRIHENFKRAC